MPVRSRRVAGPFSIPAASTVFYTVPSGRTLVVRTITLWNRSTTTAGEVRLFVTSTSAANRLRHSQLAINESVVWETWMAFDPGDTLWLTATGQAGFMVATMFGALLLGEPS